ncbi:MAG: MoaD/ThiS family protein [Caldilineaceae bacterium]
MIRVKLPHHLRNLARVNGELEVEVAPPVTQRAILDAVEAKYPVLVGTIRDRDSQQRRSLVRFFACGEDLSHESPDAILPEAVSNGKETFIVVGAMAGG